MELLAFLGTVGGLAAVGGYGYVAVMFGRASLKAGNDWKRVLVDAVTWPVMGWAAIEKLAKNPPV